MVSGRFNTLARLLGAGRSRREVAPLLVGIAAGGGLTPLLGLADAEAKKKKRRKKKKKGGTPPPPPPPCVCASGGCPFTTVQAAVDAAPAGTTIPICAGEYLERDILIDKDLTLIGAGAGADPATNTIIFGGNSLGASVIYVLAGRTVALQDLRITEGVANNGGGITNSGTLTLTGCTLTDNSAFRGGGIFNWSGAMVSLVGSSVTDNYAGVSGGGIDNSGTVACSDGSTVSGNTAGDPQGASDCVSVGEGTGCATCPA